uniref:Zinc finger protein 710 n=1 Tax=Poecilia formosa TaxID=48698 RepID=A0A087XNG0_POEFO
RQAPQRGFYLGPAPLYIKPPRFSLPSYPTIDPYSALTTPAFFPVPGLGYVPKEGFPKKKRLHLKAGAQGEESPDVQQEEAEQSRSKKKLNISHVPFSLPPRSISSTPSRPIPGMIELNRLQLHSRSAGLSLPVQVKPGPVMHIPPGPFYPREDPRSSKAPRDEAPRGETTNAEKAGLNVHVDDSYYVDVGSDQKRWKCRMCEKSYTSKYNLVTHILGHNGIKPHGCHLCGKLFKQLSHLHTHLLTHQGMRPHKCQVCHKAFTQTSHLKRHMMQHSDVKPYSCSVCGRGFAYPSELRAHELKHEKGQENVCVECGLDFPTLAQLKRHLTVHRGPTLYRCTECQKTFQYPSQLQNHMMKHKDIRPYICSECGMEFIQSHHLKQHTLTHKGVKEHKCRICGREFTLLANMKRHVLIHTNIRAYQCHMCFKSFVQKQTLKAHMIVHSDIKPYKCKLCGKEFNRMHNLMGHMHLHSDSKPFKCLYCPSKFTLKGNLTRHMKVKHGVMDRGLDERSKRNRSTSPRKLQACPASVSHSLTAKASQEAPVRRRMRRYRRSQYSPEVDQQEPPGADQYISDLKEGEDGRADELRTGKMPKLKKYLDSSEDESLEGEKKSQGQFGNTRRLLQSESSDESDEEVDEQGYAE